MAIPIDDSVLLQSVNRPIKDLKRLQAEYRPFVYKQKTLFEEGYARNKKSPCIGACNLKGLSSFELYHIAIDKGECSLVYMALY